MRARIADHRPLLAATLVALAARMPAQESGGGGAVAAGSAETSGAAGAIVPADVVGWQELAQDLFQASESSLADPGRVEPLARHMFKLGPVDLLPKFDEQVVWDDNVFLTEDHRERDFILRTGIGALADYRFGDGAHRLSAGYEMTRHLFLDGDTKNFVEQLASAQLDLRFRRLEVTLGDRYEDRTDPVLAVFTGKVERTLNTVHGRVAWREETWYGELRAQDVATQYDDSSFESFDRDEPLAVLEAGALVEDGGWGFARVDAMARSFDSDGLNDMTGAAASIGLRWKRDDTLDAMARVGLRAESFDDGFATDADDSALNPDVEARLRWWIARSTALDARLDRTTEFSPISNYEVASRGELGLLQQLDARLSARFGGGVERIEPSNTAPPFVRYTFGAGLRYALLDNADLTLAWKTRLRNTRAATGDYTGTQITLGLAVRL